MLDALPPYDTVGDVLRLVSRLRSDGGDPATVAAVLTQAKLRAKARAKFGDFADRMLFTDAGLQQATRLRVAALHAGRYAAAGARRVADLGCGIGADALALSGLDLAVTAVEVDEVTAAVAAYNLAAFPAARVLHARAEDVDLAEIDAAYLDPARRAPGHGETRRLTDPRDYSPPLEFAFGLAERMPVGVKLGPGTDRGVIPEDAEAQWVGVDGQLVELGVWTGALARPGVRRAALVLDGDGAHELTASADAPDEPAGALGDYLYEPDGAVIRARQIGELARRLGARMLDPAIAYLTADSAQQTPFAAGFRVLDRLPFAAKPLAAALRSRGIGTLEIKKRGVDVDPAELRRRLGLKGAASATLILTRVGGEHLALLAERI